MSVLSYFQRGVLTITETPGGQLARPEDNPSDNTHSLYSSSRTVRGQRTTQVITLSVLYSSPRTENLPKQYCVQQWINISSKNGTVGMVQKDHLGGSTNKTKKVKNLVVKKILSERITDRKWKTLRMTTSVFENLKLCIREKWIFTPRLNTSLAVNYKKKHFLGVNLLPHWQCIIYSLPFSHVLANNLKVNLNGHSFWAVNWNEHYFGRDYEWSLWVYISLFSYMSLCLPMHTYSYTHIYISIFI